MYNLFNCLVETIQKVYTFFIKNSNSIFAIFVFILSQKLGFQTSGESTGNAELLSQFIVEGKLIEPVSIVSNRKVWKRRYLYLKIAIKPCYLELMRLRKKFGINRQKFEDLRFLSVKHVIIKSNCTMNLRVLKFKTYFNWN